MLFVNSFVISFESSWRDVPGLFPAHIAQLTTATIDAASKTILKMRIVVSRALPLQPSPPSGVSLSLVPNMPSSADATAAITFIITFKVLMILTFLN